MPDISTLLLVGFLGTIAGILGTVLGIGGGIFLVPLLVLILHLPFQVAAAISLMAVIANSSIASAGNAGAGMINVRLGMVLEIATTCGGLCAGLAANSISENNLRRLFAAVTAILALVTLLRARRRNVVVDDGIETGPFGGRFFDHECGSIVRYRTKRMPLALFVSFLAGSISGLLGVGGGFVKVPVLNLWCGVPIRVAAATSALMIGVTAAATAPIYYARGLLAPELAAAVILGAATGSQVSRSPAEKIPPRWLKRILAVVLLLVAGLMLLEGM